MARDRASASSTRRGSFRAGCREPRARFASLHLLEGWRIIGRPRSRLVMAAQGHFLHFRRGHVRLLRAHLARLLEPRDSTASRSARAYISGGSGPDDEGDLVVVAPAPVLSSFGRPGDRARGISGMPAGVAVRGKSRSTRSVRRSSTSEGEPTCCQSQGTPRSLRSIRKGRDLDLVEVATDGHAASW